MTVEVCEHNVAKDIRCLQCAFTEKERTDFIRQASIAMVQSLIENPEGFVLDGRSLKQCGSEGLITVACVISKDLWDALQANGC